MKIETEPKTRSSESSSNDSGVMTEDSAALNDVCAHNKVNMSATIQVNDDNKVYDNEYKIVNSSQIQNGDDKVHCTTTSNQTKPSSSPESTHISIESIDEDAIDSSVIDSDSDFEDMPTNGEFIIQELGQHITPNNCKNGIIVVSQNQLDKSGSNSNVSTTPRPQIGSIAVQNSTDITFGDKTFYQGPVTIKQFLLENNKWKPKDSNGNVNPAFDGSDTEKTNGDKNGTNNQKTDYKKIFLKKKAVTITGGIILVILILITIITSSLLLAKRKDNIGGGKVLRMVSRAEWVAQPPRNTLNDLELPARRVIIAHTATEGCLSQGSCTFHVRYIQTFHMESRQWDDISYNFLVGGDGAVYEGRGWDKEGAHTKGFNKNSICIAFIGTFINQVPPDRQLNAAKLLIEEGVRLNKISKDYKLFGHRQLIPSESPGEKLYEIIKKWPHWSDEIEV
ncbi:peptidoglycan-recognition protein LC isoform X2 [Hermetia illucens]|uniref:peptidoglycan-recognition protein LC isoform X2 n=1 Tax=Hermetia illucens TaxID=343691 RepID=UPI0018CC62AF|nr:peptidoglycan-recognition protein LC isoform X2 [Hermetia illucens]